MCLTYLLAQPACELLGVTTVSGQVETRAELASAICRHAGRDDVPIHAGLDAPSKGPQLQPEAPQREALERWPHAQGFRAGAALDFLAATIEAHPGEVVLLSIGPLTNLGALFEAKPGLARSLRGVVMMAGAFRSGAGKGRWNEWNVRCDPHAAARVFATPLPSLRSVGLNVTTRVQLPAAEVRARCRHERWRPALDMAEVWFRERPDIMFHDPLAGASLFEPGMLRWNRGRVSVGTEGDDAGSTTLTLDPEGPHEVAAWVEPERFFSHFFDVAG